jgi:hypothetical protein
MVGECSAEVIRVMQGQEAPPMQGCFASRMHGSGAAALKRTHKAHCLHW